MPQIQLKRSQRQSRSELRSIVSAGIGLTLDSFAMIAAKRAAGPVAPGSKEIPYGEPNCLAGLTFVFTGELESMARSEAAELVQRYGGCVLLCCVVSPF